MKEIVVATSNPGKFAEFKALLSPIEVISQAQLGIESPDETGLTFVENALIKARFAAQMTDKPVLADDSGLVVAALNGEPGIYSARYAGADASNQANIHLLLDKMKGWQDSERAAFFYAVLVYMRHAKDPTPEIAFGKWPGFIAHEMKGEGGFGYDPVFYLPAFKATAAELPATVKNIHSHRARAFDMLKKLNPW